MQLEDFRSSFKTRSLKRWVSGINNILRVSMWVSLCLSIALVVFCVVAYVSNSDLFHVKTIDIRGCTQISKDEVMSLIDIDRNDNILSCDINMARQRLKKHPWVSDVNIKKRFFPCSLIIEVNEQKAVAAIEIESKGYLINDKGRIFAPQPSDFKGLKINASYQIDENEIYLILKKTIDSVNLMHINGLGIESVNIEPGGRMNIKLNSGISLAFIDSITPVRLRMAIDAINAVKPLAGSTIDLICDDKVVVRKGGQLASYGS